MTANIFSAQVAIINGNPYVTPPQEILEAIFSQAGKTKGTIPIRGQLNGSIYKQTLVKYAGDWRLYLNGAMLRNAGIEFKDGAIVAVVGTPVTIVAEFDPESRVLAMHPQLAAALVKDAIAQTRYESLAPYRKHEILRYLGFLKTAASIEKNITRILQHLRGEKSDALHALMHRKKDGH